MDLNKQQLTTYIQQAHDAGLPRDQVERLIQGGYIAFPKMLAFHRAARDADQAHGPDEIALGGTRYAAKSHAAMAQVFLDDCLRVPGVKFLFLRKVMKSAGESFEDLVRKILRYTKHDYKAGQVTFPNGSRVLVGGFYNESEIDKYLGLEYDGLLLEESTQLTEQKKDQIYGSIRTSIPGWRARKYHTTNPAGVGLGWFKPLFYLPWRAGTERFTRFFMCHWQDNPLAKEEYIRYLDSLSGPLRKAWRDGDFEAFEGMALPNWDSSRHIVDDFEIPYHWTRWRATDWGYAAPWSTGWLAKDPDSGRVAVYRHAYEINLTDVQQARKIVELTPPNEQIQIHYADPSMWAKKTQVAVTSTADIYRQVGVVLTKADNNRIMGWRKLRQALSDLPDGRPGLVVMRSCTDVWRTLSVLPVDPNNPEDVDTEAEDHPADMLRYGLTNYKLFTPADYQHQPAPDPWRRALQGNYL